MIELVVISVFTASLISAAWVVPRKRAVRMDREAAEDAAIRDLYDHYVTGVDSLTQAYLLQAPSDEEWLEGIRDKAAVRARERPKQTLLPVHGYVPTRRPASKYTLTFLDILTFGLASMIRTFRLASVIMIARSVRCGYLPIDGDGAAEEPRLRVKGMSLLAGTLIAVAAFCVLAHLSGPWLLPVLVIAAPVALGAWVGRAIILRPWLPGEPFEAEREGIHRSPRRDDGPGGEAGRRPGSTWSAR
jgi:hypothetical protein